MKNKAFTLIELLVVIAIIGLMASIGLIAVRDSRKKANDANIQSFMHQVRNAAEFSYIKNNESYGLVCDETGVPPNTLSDAGELGTLESAIMKENGTLAVACYESADKKDFAASSPLRAKFGKHWCVESASASIELDNAITSAVCK